MVATPYCFVLLWCAFWVLRAHAATNRTIDDTVGDSVSQVRPVYEPGTAGVWEDATCKGCFVQPDPTKAFKGTWTAATYNPNIPEISIELSFEGTAIYVFFILSQTLKDTTTVTECNFTIDGESPEHFIHEPDPLSSDILYNQLVFWRNSLENKAHSLKVSTSGQDHDIFVNFDYAIYTVADDNISTAGVEQDETTSSFTSTPTPTPTSTTTPIPEAQGPSPAPPPITSSSSSMSENSSSSSFFSSSSAERLAASGTSVSGGKISSASSSSSTSGVGPTGSGSSAASSSSPDSLSNGTIAGIAAGLAAAFLTLILTFICYRHRKRSLLRRDGMAHPLPRPTETTETTPALLHQSSANDSTESRDFLSSSAGGEKDGQHHERQLELQHQMRQIQQEIDSLNEQAMVRRRSGRNAGGMEDSIDVADLQERLRAAEARIAALQSQRHSIWSTGLSEDPPPGYEPTTSRTASMTVVNSDWR